MKINADGNKAQTRQGDVWIESTTDPIPAGVKPVKRDNGRLILAYGEVTGHAHAICAPDVDMWEDEAGTLWLKVPESATVVHEEHSAHTLKPGTYRSYIQSEYRPEAIRNVLD